MIRFSLICEHEHEFEAWFRNNDDFDKQKKRGFVDCPTCGSHKIEKALMAPAVSTSRKQEKMALAMDEAQKQAMAQLKALAEKVRENADYVGDKFAEEARKIHFGETDARGIYGEATLDEAKSLAEDGVEFMPIPVLAPLVTTPPAAANRSAKSGATGNICDPDVKLAAALDGLLNSMTAVYTSRPFGAAFPSRSGHSGSRSA